MIKQENMVFLQRHDVVLPEGQAVQLVLMFGGGGGV
jgi:hypothetical protein